MAPTIQEHEFSVPGVQAEIMMRYNIFKNLESVYHPDNYVTSILVANKDEFTGEVKSAYKDLAHYIAGVIVNVGSSAVDKMVAQDFLTSTAREFSTYLSLYSAKCLQVQSPDSSVNLTQARSNSDSNTEMARMAEIERDIDIMKMTDAIEGLRLEVNKEEEWSKSDSNTIEIAMGNVTKWREKLSFIKNKFWDVQRNTEAFDLDKDIFDRNEISVDTIVGETEAAIEKIQEEDRARCLYSGLDKTKVSPIKFPKFSGSLSEDYVKWEYETRDALVKNLVRTEDKPRVVRSNLTGQALKLIPDTIADVEVLFSALRDLYGEASRVMRSRKDQLQALGEFPAIKGKSRVAGQVRAQVEWLLSAQMILEDIVEIAKSSPDMERSAYNPDALKEYLEVFPIEVLAKLSKVQGNIETRVKTLLQVHVKEKRTELQDTLKNLKSD